MNIGILRYNKPENLNCVTRFYFLKITKSVVIVQDSGDKVVAVST